MHLALNKIKNVDDANHSKKEVVWVRDGIISVDGEEIDLSKNVLEITVSLDESSIPKINVLSLIKKKTMPIYDRNHNDFTIAYIYFDSSSKEFFIVTNDKKIILSNTYTASVICTGFPSVTLMSENVGINTSIVSIIENHFRKFWQIEDTNAQFPFHTKCNHIREKRIYRNTELTHFIGDEPNNYLILSLTRNALFDGDSKCELDHLIIPNGCEYVIKDDNITIGWNKNSSIELIPNKVDRILINGHSIQNDTGYVNIRLIKL
jgi:hypothetical protein